MWIQEGVFGGGAVLGEFGFPVFCGRRGDGAGDGAPFGNTESVWRKSFDINIHVELT